MTGSHGDWKSEWPGTVPPARRAGGRDSRSDSAWESGPAHHRPGALNSYLHMYRAEALRVTEIVRLNTHWPGRAALRLDNLRVQRVFPYGRGTRTGTFAPGFARINMEVEAAMELQRHLDISGVHQVYTIYVGGTFGFAPGLPKFAF